VVAAFTVRRLLDEEAQQVEVERLELDRLTVTHHAASRHVERQVGESIVGR